MIERPSNPDEAFRESIRQRISQYAQDIEAALTLYYQIYRTIIDSSPQVNESQMYRDFYDLNSKKLSEMPLCEAVQNNQTHNPDSFKDLGFAIIDGFVRVYDEDARFIRETAHSYYQCENLIICPTAGQFISTPEPDLPGERLRILQSRISHLQKHGLGTSLELIQATDEVSVLIGTTDDLPLIGLVYTEEPL